MAIGAAGQAAILLRNTSRNDYLCALSVVNLSLGVEGENGEMVPVIGRQTNIPTRKSIIMYKSRDTKGELNIKVYEGECPKVLDNHLLGQFKLEQIKHQSVHIEVTMEINYEEVIKVCVSHKSSNIENKLVITTANQLTYEELDRHIREAEQYREINEKHKYRIEKKHEIELYLYTLNSIVLNQKNILNVISNEEKDIISRCYEKYIIWNEANSDAEIQILDEIFWNIEGICSHILLKIIHITQNTQLEKEYLELTNLSTIIRILINQKRVNNAFVGIITVDDVD